MPTPVQIVFDCADPDRLAQFWAATLHYVLQPPPPGYASWEDALAAFGVPKEDWGSASAVVDPEGKGPRIYFQKMDTSKLGKNRLHLDVNVGGGEKAPFQERKVRVQAEAARVQGIGATRLRVEDDGREFFIVLTDPEGNEFCIQ